MTKFSKTVATMMVAVFALCISSYAFAGYYEWNAAEPAVDGGDWAYDDGLPPDYFEVIDMTLQYHGDNQFRFDIETVFADQATRDSIGPAAYSNIQPGDLYILVQDSDLNNLALYGLSFQAADDNGVDMAAGLYEIDLNAVTSSFNTGGTSGYADTVVGEIPEMPTTLLPGTTSTNRNYYPTLMEIADGQEPVTTGSVSWLQQTGEDSGHWMGDFILPTIDGYAFNPLMNGDDDLVLDVWWSMSCGNDAVRITTTTSGVDVPVPGSLALLGIGVACLAAVRRIRRK